MSVICPCDHGHFVLALRHLPITATAAGGIGKDSTSSERGHGMSGNADRGSGADPVCPPLLSASGSSAPAIAGVAPAGLRPDARAERAGVEPV
jgi:hypothetical protein